MSDQIIFDVDGLIEAQIRQRDKDYAKVCCQNLLNYAYGKGLLCDNPCDNEGNLIMPSIIKESSLTEIGKHIFVELLFKWFAYTITDCHMHSISAHYISVHQKFINKQQPC